MQQRLSATEHQNPDQPHIPPSAIIDAERAALMTERAGQASNLLKALAHEGRMMILCHLIEGEKSVGELEVLLDQRQAAVSQQLARLRSEGLVRCRRDGKARLYAVADPRASAIVALVHELFCPDGDEPAP